MMTPNVGRMWSAWAPDVLVEAQNGPVTWEHSLAVSDELKLILTKTKTKEKKTKSLIT